MLIDTAANTVEKSLQAYFAKQDDYYYKALEKNIAFIEGEHKPYISELISRSDKEGIPYSYTNLTKHILRKKSMVYHTPPARGIKGNEKAYTELTEYKDQRMKTCEVQARLQPYIMVRPYLVDDNKKFKYQIVRLFHALEDPKNIEYPAAIMYPLGQYKKSEKLWEYWDKDNHFVFSNFGKKIKNQEQFGINNDMKNEFGEIPFAAFRFDDVIDDIRMGGAFDLVDANEMIDLALTELNYEFRWQSFKQVYVTGDNASNIMDITTEFGYNKIIKFQGEKTNIGTLDLQPRFLDSIEVIKFQMNTIAMNYDVSMKWELSGSAESGFALIVKNIDLLNSWTDDIGHCRKWESDLFRKEQLVYETITKKKLPASEMHVDFSEVIFPVNPQEKRDKWDWEFQHNISTPLDYMKAESPDTPEEELKKRLIDNAVVSTEITPEKKPLTFEERLGGANV